MEPQNVGENRAKNAEDRLRSSSASSASAASATSEFSFEDPNQINTKEHGSFAHDHEQSEQALLQPETLASDTGDASGANLGSSSALESPPVQVMERPTEGSGYRIPSYVFARNKSNTPNAEWSTASNESLFSIHTGNMSFTREQFSWLLKSGELGTYGPGDIRKSGELPPSDEQKMLEMRKSGEQMPPVPQDTGKSGEEIIAAHFKTSSSPSPAVKKVGVMSSPRANEANVPDLVVGTNKDDIQPEKKDDKGTKKLSSDEIPLMTSVSHHSDASGQSFAFPVLAEIDREKSVNSGLSRVDQQKSSSANDHKDAPKSPTSAPEAAPASSWFSRFSCCSCC